MSILIGITREDLTMVIARLQGKTVADLAKEMRLPMDTVRQRTQVALTRIVERVRDTPSLDTRFVDAKTRIYFQQLPRKGVTFAAFLPLPGTALGDQPEHQLMPEINRREALRGSIYLLADNYFQMLDKYQAASAAPA